MKKKRTVVKSEDCHKSVSIPATPMMTLEDYFISSIQAVEHILKYRFKDKSLLAAALTHSSYTDSPSYQRLEFVGDAALGLAFGNFVFITYPSLDPGQLSHLRASNISTEKLARVAVKHGLFHYVRHNAPALLAKVSEFSVAIQEEDDDISGYGGKVKAPKVLADIVESIAAAIYVDVKFDLQLMWEVISPLLEPIVTLENLQQQPVTMLYELCQKEGKNVRIQQRKNGEKNIIVDVFVNGKILASACSEQKETSKLIAAKRALDKLCISDPMLMNVNRNCDLLSGVQETSGAKQKLIAICGKRHSPEPTTYQQQLHSYKTPRKWWKKTATKEQMELSQEDNHETGTLFSREDKENLSKLGLNSLI
ncbi:hypothetical protein IFM89_027989 [Coptis chinensis]|uniref:Uncharacterized protein n=1 Tax=Coptis chinensis TaxID=261450 RepID=A0A835GZP1_9MAGN|nr:hypothetical protein IFM89_027989 [Coptis chinensis]